MLLADAIERGELALDSTAGEILARRPVLAERTAGPLHELTLRELCTHTSGLPRLRTDAGAAGAVRAARDSTPTAAARRRRCCWPPRTSGYAAAAAIATRTSVARSPVSCWRSRQATISACCCTIGSSRRCRWTPRRSGQGRNGRVGSHATGLGRQPWALDGYAPAGGVISTIEDVATLTAALVDGSAPGIGRWRRWTTSPRPRPGREAGIFWVDRAADRATAPTADPRHRADWHNGQTGGYSAFVGIVRDQRRGVAVLADIARAPEQRADRAGSCCS